VGKLSITDQYYPMGTCGELYTRPGIVRGLMHRRLKVVIVTAVAALMPTMRSGWTCALMRPVPAPHEPRFR
jgi:hypothetical protein